MPTPTNPQVSRRRLLRALGVGLAAPAGLMLYAWQVEPFWPEFHTLPMPVRNLPPRLEGMRVAHLSDLHVSSKVSHEYARGVVRRVNQMRPDAVVITGDLVTISRGHIAEACEVIGAIDAPTYVSFGNHDYGGVRVEGRDAEVSEELHARLAAGGATVLRNSAVSLSQAGEPRVWLVGLEDLWSGKFSPAVAFSAIRPGDGVIAMSHNPDTAGTIDGYGADWILSGHTHGGQLRIPGYGAVLLPVQNQNWQRGQFSLPNGGMLYVSRGVGFLLRARFACRPEVPTFVLTRAPASE